MPILNRITETVDGEELTMEEQVFVVRVVNDGETFWLKRTIFTSDIDSADGFESIDDAAAALIRAERFMKPAIRKKCVVVPYGGDFVRA